MGIPRRAGRSGCGRGVRGIRGRGRSDPPPAAWCDPARRMTNQELGTSILVVEDDDQLRGVVADSLREEGFRVELAATGADALRRVEQTPVDLLVVDIGLPDTDGRDLCQALRARGTRTPVLFLTARDALVDRIAGFDAGGDDYLTKPFALVELVARIHAVLRRSGVEEALEAAGL